MSENTTDIAGIEVKNYVTTKAHREYRENLLAGVSANTGNIEEFDLPLTNIAKAELSLVKNMTGLSETQIDDMSQEKYEKIVEYIKSLPQAPLSA